MIKKTFLILAVIGLMIPFFASAQDSYGIGTAAESANLPKSVSGASSIPELIGTIVGVVLSFVGAIFFLLILYAGFLWMTAFGSSEKADKAKSIMEHAAIGLVIVLAAYAISRFVFNALKVGEGSSGGSSVSSAVCPIGSIDGVTACGVRQVCDCPGKLANDTCDQVGTCVERCAYANKVFSKNYACTDVSATGGECPGGRIKEIGWCASPSANVVCCHDP